MEVVPSRNWDVEEVIDQVSNAHNSLVRKGGYSPTQHVLGVDVRVPSMLVQGVQMKPLDLRCS